MKDEEIRNEKEEFDDDQAELDGQGLKKTEKDRAEEFDAKTMKDRVGFTETADSMRDGLAKQEELLLELKKDLKGGWHIVERLMRMVPADRRDGMIRKITTAMLTVFENERRSKNRYGETWRHPFNVSVNTEYYRCTCCGGRLGDEMIVTVERRRDGDKIYTFCGRKCIENHEWQWLVDA